MKWGVDLGERLHRLSKAEIMSGIKIAGKLVEAVGKKPGLAITAVHAARNAHLLSTLNLNLARVELAASSSGEPMGPLFAAQQVCKCLISPKKNHAGLCKNTSWLVHYEPYI